MNRLLIALALAFAASPIAPAVDEFQIDLPQGTADGGLAARSFVPAANQFLRFGSDRRPTAVTLVASHISDSTGTGRSILLAADAATVRGILSLGSLATASTVSSTDIADGTTLGRGLLTSANATTARTLLGLGSLATASTVPSSAISDSTATGRSLLTASNAAAGRTALGLGNLSTANTLVIADTIGLQAALDGKAATVHDHSGQDLNPGNVEAAVLDLFGTGETAGYAGFYTQGGTWWTRLMAPNATANRNLTLPNEDGELATQGWTSAGFVTSTDFGSYVDTQFDVNAGFTSDIAGLTSGKAPKGAIGSSGMTQAPSKVLGRTSAGTGAIEELGISAVLDLVGGLGQGSVLYRGATQWAATGTGNAGEVLTSGGTGNNPTWAAGGGLPTQTGNSGKLLATNGTAASWTTTTAQLDGIGSTRGQILYRGSSAWSALAAGTSGYYLRANGAGADPTWNVLPVVATSGGVGYGSAPTGAGTYSLAGGFQPDCPKDMSIALGTYPYGEVYSSLHLSGGRFATNGDAQTIVGTFRNSATNATPVEVFANGSSERFTVKANTVASCDMRIVIKKQSNTDCATFWRRATLCRDGSNNTSLVGSAETIGTDVNSPGYAVTVAADDTNESLKVTVTGAAATNIRAAMTLIVTETSY